MINKLKLKVPYPIRVGFFSLNTKKTINFSFDNLSLFLFREDNGIETMADFNEWKKQHTDYDLFVLGAYYAAKSYAQHNRQKFNLNVSKFALGVASSGEENIKKLMSVWQRSNTYGSDSLGKKKAEKN